MPRKRIKMIIQEEIIRLKKLGHSQRKVAKILGINRETVTKYWNGPPDLNSNETSRTPNWAKSLDWNYIEAERKNGIYLIRLWEELKDIHGLPGYPSFFKYVKKHHPIKKDIEISLRINRTPGDSLEIDYSGDGLQYIIPSTGEVRKAELFVAVMSYSGKIYAEFTETQKMNDFIRGHVNALKFFGGVPKFIVPDNCKTAVVKIEDGEAVLNPTYLDLCRHYKVVADPARVRKPQDKPNVEKAVDILQGDFFQKVRKKTFTSLHELNNELRRYLKNKNAQIVKTRGKSRDELFNEELPLLKELPCKEFEIFNHRQAKAHPDCHIQFSRNFYSIPYQYVGKILDLKFNEKILHIFSGGSKIATHKIMEGHTHYSTDLKHYPEKKLADINYHLLQAKNTARKVGENVELLITRLIEREKHPLKNLRKIQGILSLSGQFTKEAFDNACERALIHDKLFYQFIKNCASNYRRPSSNFNNKAPSRMDKLICLQGGKNE